MQVWSATLDCFKYNYSAFHTLLKISVTLSFFAPHANILTSNHSRKKIFFLPSVLDILKAQIFFCSEFFFLYIFFILFFGGRIEREDHMECDPIK